MSRQMGVKWVSLSAHQAYWPTDVADKPEGVDHHRPLVEFLPVIGKLEHDQDSEDNMDKHQDDSRCP